MRTRILALFTVIMSLSAFGCGSDDIPQAHKGRMFDRTGALAFWSGGDGFSGTVLGPGTYWTGVYDQVRVVECAEASVKEPLESLTSDNVQFKMDMYITFSADCESATGVEKLLNALSPDKDNTISKELVYNTYIRPAIGEAVRSVISPIKANEINKYREKVEDDIRVAFNKSLFGADTAAKSANSKPVLIPKVTLSNMDFPDEMDHANTSRAVQDIMKDKAIAERDRVDAEIETSNKKKVLAQKEGEVEAAKIDQIGAALRRNPEYLQFDMQSKMTELYKEAGAKGNMVIAAPAPQLMLNSKNK